MVDDHDVDEDEITSLVHAHYTACKYKPSDDYQYTVLAAFVLSSPSQNHSGGKKHLKVISLATGAKCLPTSKFSERGDSLHDSHAEVLARRGAIRWLYEEVQRHTLRGETVIEPTSPWLSRISNGKFKLKDGISVHMYISTLPCMLVSFAGGDASISVLAALQDPEMAALKTISPPSGPSDPTAASRGREGYSRLGALRTKPGRADAPPTTCMSCADKIASWNALGMQGALASSIFEPIYISSIVIGDVPEDLRFMALEDCERSLYGRVSRIEENLSSSFRLARPQILFTSIPFIHSRTVLQEKYRNKFSPPSSNESLCWFADSEDAREVIINGTRRGIGAKLRSQEKYRPRLCKLSLYWLHEKVLTTLGTLGTAPVSNLNIEQTYFNAKRTACSDYHKAKASLRGPGGPFVGWVVSGEKYESFDIEGVFVNLVASTVRMNDELSTT